MPGYRVYRRDELELMPPSRGDQSRRVLRLSDSLAEMHANVWLMPSGSRGRRHRELVQEELFVALEGTATLFLGDPPEVVELPPGSLAVVEPHTPIQLANTGAEDALVVIVGAPPEEGQAEYLPNA
jgi:mannose-6-phosphate isomerase-like protein (cupin superfamily)